MQFSLDQMCVKISETITTEQLVKRNEKSDFQVHSIRAHLGRIAIQCDTAPETGTTRPDNDAPSDNHDPKRANEATRHCRDVNSSMPKY
jgi:hypothetical protein